MMDVTDIEPDHATRAPTARVDPTHADLMLPILQFQTEGSHRDDDR